MGAIIPITGKGNSSHTKCCRDYYIREGGGSV